MACAYLTRGSEESLTSIPYDVTESWAMHGGCALYCTSVAESMAVPGATPA